MYSICPTDLARHLVHSPLVICHDRNLTREIFSAHANRVWLEKVVPLLDFDTWWAEPNGLGAASCANGQNQICETRGEGVHLHFLSLFVAWTRLSTTVRPKKDKTRFNNPPKLRIGTVARDFWGAGVERLSPCDVNNIGSNTYVAWGRNLCSLQLEIWETLRTYCEFDMTRYEKQDLHCVDESFAVKTSCANGTVCRFWATVVKGWLERCFAAKIQCKNST